MDLYEEEDSFYQEGVSVIAGVDEVGRGCLAGPVFAAAVILPRGIQIPNLNDSKKLSPKVREEVSQRVLDLALAYQIAQVSVEEIDRLNILRASLQAMKLAIHGLSVIPHLLLIDGNQQVAVELSQHLLIGGDGRCASIAAASVIAKVARDRYMTEQEKLYPGFNFSRHKGYGTIRHLDELNRFGPTPLHRRSFSPVSQMTFAL